MTTLTKINWLLPESAKKISVRTGDVYQFACATSTRAGHTHHIGTLLVVQKRTKESPFGEIGPRGCNWQCITEYGSSIWATLETSIERGLLRLVHRR